MIYFLTTIFITSSDISTLKTKQLWTLKKTSMELLPLSHNTLTSRLFYFRVNCFWAGDLRYNQFWRNRCEIPPGQYKTCSISFTYCWYIIEPTDLKRCSFDYTFINQFTCLYVLQSGICFHYYHRSWSWNLINLSWPPICRSVRLSF